ncbi:uncharacterized protein CLUP02_02868 [Colletotrichum lupini]|uniref:Aminoglycoside phosphotransferase domain-containing protein n=1 Tax=Colletotrichum lupini TaxID=145971 RepID=A0A9Q8SHS3_9PEZI|nr:uncharacterized protein CLUP02_02868 [Colletotrichum lupini]UQC77400.1 hypothetical protein CLUP02_02868 [Colletotrichum lupini]
MDQLKKLTRKVKASITDSPPSSPEEPPRSFFNTTPPPLLRRVSNRLATGLKDLTDRGPPSSPSFRPPQNESSSSLVPIIRSLSRRGAGGSGRNRPIPHLPYRIPDPDPMAPLGGGRSTNPGSVKHIRDKFVRWTARPGGEYDARWKGACIPTGEHVSKMLEWYTQSDVYEFPFIGIVTRMSCGATNAFYFVEFEPTSRPVGQGKSPPLPRQVILKLSLPVCPHEKLEAEVAAMVFARQVSPAVVPQILVFDSIGRNPLGLEWMIMEVRTGFPLLSAFEENYILAAHDLNMAKQDTGLEGFGDISPETMPSLSDEDTKAIAREVQLVLSKLQSSLPTIPKNQVSIGSLRIDWSKKEFFTGPIVHPHFYSRDRYWQVRNNGPFRYIEDYIDAYTSVWEPEFRSHPEIKVQCPQSDSSRKYWWQRGWLACNILFNGNRKLASIMGWEDAVLIPAPLRNLPVALDWAMQLHGVTDAIDPMQEWAKRHVSESLEPVMNFQGGVDASFQALKIACEEMMRQRSIDWIERVHSQLVGQSHRERGSIRPTCKVMRSKGVDSLTLCEKYCATSV